MPPKKQDPTKFKIERYGTVLQGYSPAIRGMIRVHQYDDMFSGEYDQRKLPPIFLTAFGENDRELGEIIEELRQLREWKAATLKNEAARAQDKFDRIEKRVEQLEAAVTAPLPWWKKIFKKKSHLNY